MSLVLTRRVGESIIFQREGKNQRIYIVSIEGNTVRLAIDALQDVKILRRELMDEAGLAYGIMGDIAHPCRSRGQKPAA